MSDDIILKATNISKQYRLGLVGTGTLSHDLNRWWARIRGKEDPYLRVGDSNNRATKGNSEYVWALKDINFEVKKGEVLGIIGKNGAGKSTLLKILSKVTGPSVGEIKTKGRIASLLEVGTGFHPELTGKENIYLNGAILGMTKKEISSKIEEIVDFSGCQRFIDTPVKRYSSGMTVRLAFAVAAHLEPEILVIDEVLAVGDAEFQKKAIGKMQDISKGEGRTVLFVSHNMAAIKSLCTRAVVLKYGKVVFKGSTNDSVEYYLKNDTNNSLNYRVSKNDYKKIHIKSVEIIANGDNKGIQEFNKDFKLEIEVYTPNKIESPAVSYQILNRDNIPVVHELILNDEHEFCQQKGAYKLISIIKNIKLYQGNYKLNVYFSDNFTKVSYDKLTEICQFEIINTQKRPYYWSDGSAIYKESDTNWEVLKLNE